MDTSKPIDLNTLKKEQLVALVQTRGEVIKHLLGGIEALVEMTVQADETMSSGKEFEIWTRELIAQFAVAEERIVAGQGSGAAH